MFEKEAEEYANEYGQDAFTQFNMPQWIEPIRMERKLGFQKGAEFGYNKANEWHKPSEKLPEECSLVLAYSFDDTEPALWEFITSDQWEWLPKRIVFCSNDQIRLWKEIVLPSEPMRSLDKEELKNYTEAIKKVYKPTGAKLFDKESE